MRALADTHVLLRWLLDEGISPAIAAAVASLPSTFNRDPADRVIVATALTLGATLLTSDEAIVGARIVTTVE